MSQELDSMGQSNTIVFWEFEDQGARFLERTKGFQ